MQRLCRASTCRVLRIETSMEWTLHRRPYLLLAACFLTAGCALRNRPEVDFGQTDVGYYQQYATAIEYPDAENPALDDLAQTAPPRPSSSAR